MQEIRDHLASQEKQRREKEPGKPQMKERFKRRRRVRSLKSYHQQILREFRATPVEKSKIGVCYYSGNSFWHLLPDKDRSGSGFACREQFISGIASTYKDLPQKEPTTFFFNVVLPHRNSRSPDPVGDSLYSMAVMQQHLHAVESVLGYRRHQLKLLAHQVDPTTNHRLVWGVTASRWWRQSAPMLSFFTGEMRRGYCHNLSGACSGIDAAKERDNGIFYNLLLQFHPTRLFGRDRQAHWDPKRNFVAGTFGVVRYLQWLRTRGDVAAKLKLPLEILSGKHSKPFPLPSLPTGHPKKPEEGVIIGAPNAVLEYTQAAGVPDLDNYTTSAPSWWPAGASATRTR